MSVWTLADIRQKVRQVTGRFSTNDMSNTELDERINKYYQLRFPADVKLEAKHTQYQLTTTPNQPTYAAPLSTYTNFEPEASVNNLKMDWYQNQDAFFGLNLLQYSFQIPWTGDGTAGPFTTTLGGFPIYPATLTIANAVETFQDTNETYTINDVVLTGTAGGTATINYSTGVISVTFAALTTTGENIHLNYVMFQPGRPLAILYFNNQFQLYPVPDQAYIIKMGAYQVVSPLVNATDTPDLNEWGPCIAYGTSLDIFADKGENDSYAETLALYKEQVSIILTRTEQSLLNVRAMPNF